MKDLKIFAKTIEPQAQAQIDLLLAQKPFEDCKVRIMPSTSVISVSWRRQSKPWSDSGRRQTPKDWGFSSFRQTMNGAHEVPPCTPL